MEQRIPWVKGNTLNLAVPLQLVTVNNGQQTKTDYIPPAGSEINVRITNRFGGKDYPYTISGNVVSFKDDGTLQVGCYGVEITVAEPQTEQVDGQKRRTFKKYIEIYNSVEELGELPDGEIILDAAIFIQGQKGDKGDTGEKGDKGDKGDTGERGQDGAPIYPVFAITEDMHLVSDEASNRINVNNSGHLVIDY